jgi:mRNA-degrading endonuclease toxin of MazEF toxin-antitoxin module
LGQQVKRWGIYQVPDELIQLPPDSGKRTPKKSRYFVVISNISLDFVLGCPTSTDPNLVIKPWDVELPAGVCGTQQQCWVRVPAVQPLDKKHLTNRTGEVPGPDLRRAISMNIFDFMQLDQIT